MNHRQVGPQKAHRPRSTAANERETRRTWPCGASPLCASFLEVGAEAWRGRIRDGHTCRGRIVERRRRGATGVALRLEVPARAEDMERFSRHGQEIYWP